jgi:hypothetical protein
MKLMARRAGFGSAQDMLSYGEQLPSIMQAGRWKTEKWSAATRQSKALRMSAGFAPDVNLEAAGRHRPGDR